MERVQDAQFDASDLAPGPTPVPCLTPELRQEAEAAFTRLRKELGKTPNP